MNVLKPSLRGHAVASKESLRFAADPRSQERQVLLRFIQNDGRRTLKLEGWLGQV